jgi:hypothetical protein
MTKNYTMVFLISFFFAFIVGKGFYGFGVDYYQAYYTPNVSIGGVTDRLGWIISTLTVGNLKLGVYIVSFLLSLSAGILLLTTQRKYFSKKNIWIFYVAYIALLHTWPIIQSTSNAMRQGLSMSLLFLSIHFLLSKKYTYYFIALILVSTLHKSGALFSMILLGSSVYYIIMKKYLFSDHFINKTLIQISFLFLVIFYFLLLRYFPDNKPSVIISGDFRLPFLFINIMYVVFYAKYLLIKSDQIDRFLLVTSFILPIFLFQGFNWEYERLNMIIVVLYVISFSRLFVFNQEKVVLLFTILCLLLLTIVTGMYESFH